VIISLVIIVVFGSIGFLIGRRGAKIPTAVAYSYTPPAYARPETVAAIKVLLVRPTLGGEPIGRELESVCKRAKIKAEDRHIIEQLLLVSYNEGQLQANREYLAAQRKTRS
jgi:hypothetical protein